MQDEVLVKAIVVELEANPEGLVEREIRLAVLKSTGLRRRPVEIRKALQSNSDLFVGPLADGRWRLKAVIEMEEIVTSDHASDDLRMERGDVSVPFLAHFPQLDSFIAFDLETTGVNPDRDQIIQISAVRIIDGQPSSRQAEDGTELAAVFDEYVRLEGRDLPYGLKVKLGFTDHPQWEEALQQADSLGNVLYRFRLWIADLPLVAHNARFDYEFLQQAARTIDWLVPQESIIDTMELACLARPDMKSFRLEELAKELGIADGEAGGEQVADWASREGVTAFSWTGFHNAVVDVLVLAALVPRLLSSLRQRFSSKPELAWLLHQLLPHLAAQLSMPSPAFDLPVDALIRQMVSIQPVSRAAFALTGEAFSPEGVRQRFEEMISRKGLKQRQSQLEMVTAVSRALQENRFMVVEAPTGTGKTFAYLVPSIYWARSQGEPVIISTHTRLLQDQMAMDLDKVKDTLDLDFHAQLLKGIARYICLERTAALFAQIDIKRLDIEERFSWLYLLSWLATTDEGVLDQLSYWVINTFPVLAQISSNVRADRGECSQQRCAKCSVCFHRLAYARAEVADIVVMNHALLLSKDWQESGFPFTRVIVDEAHNLENTATDAATNEVSTATLNYLVNRLLDQRNGQGVLIRLRDKIRDADGQRLIAVALNKRRYLKTLIDDFGDRLRRYVEQNQAQVDPRYGAKLTLESNPERANPVSWQPVNDAKERLIHALQETGSVVRHLFDWLGQNPLPQFQIETRNELYYLADKFAGEAALLNSLLRVNYESLKTRALGRG